MEQSKLADNPILVFGIVIFIITTITIPTFYNSNRELFNSLILEMSLFNIGFFTHFSEKAIENYNTIQAMNPREMSWDEVHLVLYYTGLWVRYPFALILFIMGTISILLNRKRRLYRKFNMKSLTEHNKEHFPCIIPVVGKGEYLQDVESFDKGHWKVARTSMQFCVENKLVSYPNNKEIQWEEAFKNGIAHIDMPAYGQAVLRQERFKLTFAHQLGCQRREFHALPPIRKVMVTSFLAYGNDDKKSAAELLDMCSITYTENENHANCACLNDRIFMQKVNALHQKYHAVTQSKLIQKHTFYELPYFMALLYFARKKGILAPSQFLFLRPIDRTLWYTLHQCGGQVAWVEALSPWLHYHEEEKRGKSLEDFSWQSAYTFIKNDLDSQGWLHE